MKMELHRSNDGEVELLVDDEFTPFKGGMAAGRMVEWVRARVIDFMRSREEAMFTVRIGDTTRGERIAVEQLEERGR